ncbi:MAG: YdeI/OmpD-associated family protein [Acidimicrobiia bacterium]|nr:YdeI/OmpD-associated family protein [Acidimicrobiia bacterium]
MTVSFRAELHIIDGNPYVDVPETVLEDVFEVAGREKGPIPIRGSINGQPYQQTLVRFRGAWRLYVNMQMLHDSPRRIGEALDVEVAYDPSDRTIETPPKFAAALRDNAQASEVFAGLTPSRQKEIIRYISSLKTEAAVDRNVERAIRFLVGDDRFVGRDKP